MHGGGDLAPALGLLGRPHARHAEIAHALGADRRALGDDQAGAGALAVIVRHQVVGNLGRACAQPRQGRHEDAIGQDQIAEDQRLEQGRHDGHSQGGTLRIVLARNGSPAKPDCLRSGSGKLQTQNGGGLLRRRLCSDRAIRSSDARRVRRSSGGGDDNRPGGCGRSGCWDRPPPRR